MALRTRGYTMMAASSALRVHLLPESEREARFSTALGALEGAALCAAHAAVLAEARAHNTVPERLEAFHALCEQAKGLDASGLMLPKDAREHVEALVREGDRSGPEAHLHQTPPGSGDAPAPTMTDQRRRDAGRFSELYPMDGEEQAQIIRQHAAFQRDEKAAQRAATEPRRQEEPSQARAPRGREIG